MWEATPSIKKEIKPSIDPWKSHSHPHQDMKK